MISLPFAGQGPSVRVPDPDFPRWLPWVRLDEGFHAHLAVDLENVLHAVWVLPRDRHDQLDEVAPTTAPVLWTLAFRRHDWRLMYSHNQYPDRRANGWREPEIVTRASELPSGRYDVLLAPDIDVDANGDLQVAFEAKTAPLFGGLSDIFHVIRRKRTRRWLRPRRLTSASGFALRFTPHNVYFHPHLRVDRDDAVHVAFYNRQLGAGDDWRRIQHRRFDNGWSGIATVHEGTVGSDDFPFTPSRIDVDPDGVPHFAWVQHLPKKPLFHPFYALRLGPGEDISEGEGCRLPGVLPPDNFHTDLLGLPIPRYSDETVCDVSCDPRTGDNLAGDPQNRALTLYVAQPRDASQPADLVRHRARRPDGWERPPETASRELSRLRRLPLIGADSRGRPHGTWYVFEEPGESPFLSYSAKVEGQESFSARHAGQGQEPILQGGTTPDEADESRDLEAHAPLDPPSHVDLAVNRNDNVYYLASRDAVVLPDFAPPEEPGLPDDVPVGIRPPRLDLGAPEGHGDDPGGSEPGAPGESSELLIENPGRHKLVVESLRLYGGDHFTLDGVVSDRRLAIPPGGSLRILVTFSPRSPGVHRDAVVVGLIATPRPITILVPAQGAWLPPADPAGDPIPRPPVCELRHLALTPIHFTQMLELNVGDQDGFVTFDLEHPATSVNLANGNLRFQIPLFDSAGVGISTSLALVHNTLHWDKGVLSPGWTHNYHVLLIDHGTGVNDENDVITLRTGDSRSVIYRYSERHGVLLAYEEFGYFSRLERGGTARYGKPETRGRSVAYLLTNKYGNEHHFDDRGKLVRVVDTNDNELLIEFGDGVPQRIEDSAGRETTLGYNRERRVVRVVNAAHRAFVLKYEDRPGEFNKLIEVRFRAHPGALWTLEYHREDRFAMSERRNLPSRLTPPRGNADPEGPWSFDYFYQPDNRFQHSLDPEEEHVPEDGEGMESWRAVRGVEYVDERFQRRVVAEVAPDGRRVRTAEIQLRKTVIFHPRDSEALRVRTKVEHEYKRSLGFRGVDPLGFWIKRCFDRHRNVIWAAGKRANARDLEPRGNADFLADDDRATRGAYTYDPSYERSGGMTPPTRQEPRYVKDNLWYVHRPGTKHPVEHTYTNNGLNRTSAMVEARLFTPVAPFTRGPVGPIVTILSYGADDRRGNARTLRFHDWSFDDPRETRTEYDDRGRVTELRKRGFVTRFRYEDGATGLVTGVVRQGLFLTEKPYDAKPEKMRYDVLGNLKAQILPEGGRTSFKLDGLNRVVEVRKPPGSERRRPRMRFRYDAEDNVVVAIDELHRTISYDYDRPGRLRRWKVPGRSGGSDVLEYFYDVEGNVRRIRDLNGHEKRFRYNARDELVYEEGPQVQDAEGASYREVYEYQYDPAGNRNVESRRSQPPGSRREWRFAHDDRANLLEIQHPEVEVVYKDRAPARQRLVEYMSYDDNDNLLQRLLRVNGQFVRGKIFRYDERNRRFQVLRLGGDPEAGTTPGEPSEVTTFVHDEDDNLVEVYPPGSETPVRRVVYDSRNLPVVIRLAAESASAFAYGYDGDGNNTSGFLRHQSRWVVVQLNNYLPNGLVKREEFLPGHPDAQVTRYAYDIRGRLREIQRGTGTSFSYDYDARDRVILKVEREGETTRTARYEYDANGNLVHEVTGFPGATRDLDVVTDYDATNRAVRQVQRWRRQADGRPFDERRHTFAYDRFGLLAEKTLVRGNRSRRVIESHDALERLVGRQVYLDGKLKGDRGFTHDLLNSIFVAFERVGSADLEFTLDPLGRIRKRTLRARGAVTAVKNVEYRYENGFRRQLIGPAGEVVDYQYDANGRLAGLAEASRRWGFAYDRQGKMTAQSYPNGMRRLVRYGTNLQPEHIQMIGAHGSVVSSLTYRYLNGNVEGVYYAHLGYAQSFLYDDAGARVVGESGASCLVLIDAEPFENAFTDEAAGDESGFSNTATATPAAAPTPTGYFAFYEYDDLGSRIRQLDDKGTVEREFQGDQVVSESRRNWVPVPVSELAVDSTDPADPKGFAAQHLVDGGTADSSAPGDCWASAGSGGRHWAVLAFGGERSFVMVRLYLPTDQGLVEAFRLQYWDTAASRWTNLARGALGVLGARRTPGRRGWWRALCHEIVLLTTPIRTPKIRYLQAANGGPRGSRTARVNEMRAFSAGSATTVGFKYDSRDNLRLIDDPAGAWKLEHDHLDRLARVEGPAGRWRQLYSAFGDRYGVKDLDSGEVRLFVHDGPDVVADYLSAGGGVPALSDRYVNYPAIDFKLSRDRPGASALHYFTDFLGTPHQIFDDAQQAVATVVHSAWGVPVVRFGIADRHGLAGRETLDPSGALYDFRARQYVPGLGFLQRDPEDPDSWSRQGYVYAANHPVMLTDPTGEAIPLLIIGAIALVGIGAEVAHAVGAETLGDILEALSPGHSLAKIIIGTDRYGNELTPLDYALYGLDVITAGLSPLSKAAAAGKVGTKLLQLGRAVRVSEHLGNAVGLGLGVTSLASAWDQQAEMDALLGGLHGTSSPLDGAADRVDSRRGLGRRVLVSEEEWAHLAYIDPGFRWGRFTKWPRFWQLASDSFKIDGKTIPKSALGNILHHARKRVLRNAEIEAERVIPGIGRLDQAISLRRIEGTLVAEVTDLTSTLHRKHFRKGIEYLQRLRSRGYYGKFADNMIFRYTEIYYNSSSGLKSLTWELLPNSQPRLISVVRG